MGEIVPFRSSGFPACGVAGQTPSAQRTQPPRTVFQHQGWRILAVPAAGRFLAVADHCRRGIEVGRFDPRADGDERHGGTEVAILTRCAWDERLARCAVAWLNADGPHRAILSAFIVNAAGRYHFWRDAVIETALIGGNKLVRLIDGSIALSREPEPVPLLDPFAPIAETRRRGAFHRLLPETQDAVLRWADPSRQFGARFERGADGAATFRH